MNKTAVRNKKTAKNQTVYVVTKTAICRDDPDDSIFEIVGIFKSRPDALKAKNVDQKKEDKQLQEMEDDGCNPYDMPDFEYQIKSMSLK